MTEKLVNVSSIYDTFQQLLNRFIPSKHTPTTTTGLTQIPAYSTHQHHSNTNSYDESTKPQVLRSFSLHLKSKSNGSNSEKSCYNLKHRFLSMKIRPSTYVTNSTISSSPYYSQQNSLSLKSMSSLLSFTDLKNTFKLPEDDNDFMLEKAGIKLDGSEPYLQLVDIDEDLYVTCSN